MIVDSSLRTPLGARVLKTGRSPVWIATVRGHDPGRARRLAGQGAEILTVPSRTGRVDLGALLALLGKRDVVSVLVEGGSRLAAALIAEGRVDELCWFSAPLLIGGDGVPMISALGVDTPARAPRLLDLRERLVGPDRLFSARLRRA